MARRKNDTGPAGLIPIFVLLSLPFLSTIIIGAAFAGPTLLIAAQIYFRVSGRAGRNGREAFEKDTVLSQKVTQFRQLQSKIEETYLNACRQGLVPRAHGFDRRNARAELVNDHIETMLQELNNAVFSMRPRFRRMKWIACGRSAANAGVVVYAITAIGLGVIAGAAGLAGASLAALVGGCVVYWYRSTEWEFPLDGEFAWESIREAFGSDYQQETTGDEQPDEYVSFEEPEEGATESPKEWYEILGVDASASRAEIHAAYRDKVKQYHPDRVQGLGEKLHRLAEDETKALNSAYHEGLEGLAR